ncbi:MAG: ribosomal-protein-alanine N-acetyltransferase [Deltaproteobacteria bacterium HGW-Deltaproteobacteria-7]|nr:MAG: ribosomal-protein-alanine N-acetyltransferase [Deltaproteobacteria bacterium HGW-Deltaproteobacteria-7]PKN21059.1 MAG: ribosomal-protein-alanine N-acetyltransferase [Deltaproteobacteria bacterium HGW-Deltaproteobacteria-6]
MKKEDLQEIMAIERASFPAPWTEGMFLDEIRTKHAQCLIIKIEMEGKTFIAGYIIFWLVADEVHLHNLAVRNEFRRSGLACNMINLMKDIAAQVGITRHTLEVRESNHEAINLYRKCGFVVKGKRPHYYTDTHEDALIMWAGREQEKNNG